MIKNADVNTLSNLTGLSEIKIKLGYNTFRSVKSWCKNNGVTILGEGSKKWVNTLQFNIAFYKQFIQELKENYPIGWADIFKAFMENDAKKLLELTEKKTELKPTRYTPKSRAEEDFLNQMDDI